MKILIDGRVLKHSRITGVERYTREVIKALKKVAPKNFQIDTIVPSSDNKYVHHIWEHTVLPLIARNYDILFCPANIAPVWKCPRTKLVVTVHDLSFISFPYTFSRKFQLYYKALIPYELKTADIVITVSNYIKSEIINKFNIPRNKIFAIPLGVNIDFLRIPPTSKKENYLLFLGSLNPRKNIKGVIEAFSRLLNRIPHQLLIVGGRFDIFKNDKKIYKLIKSIPADRIKLKGHLRDKEIIELYRKAGLFIFPSLYEGFGLPPLEAMACGCPVVVSNAASLPEVCGDAAYYVDPYDVDSIAEGIYKVLTDENLRQSLIQRGLERAKLFSWGKTAEQTLEVFEKVLNENCIST
ncbi:MAG: glycosyltransferase family 4 protein [Candidatus Desulfofervidaceae bacterium]|nr:glycosyltransferase family 4 protein [Candidatus Desulfofervidaceae bacterium]